MSNVLLMTSNGAGMGHLTRLLAVALALGPDHRATLFSLSLGLPTVTGLGVAGEYCPSYDRPWVATRNWNSYLRDRLVAIIEETGTDVVVFDGVAPYPGIAGAAREKRDVAFVWLRRGMWKDTNHRALAKGRFFDLVIEPGDLAGEADHGPTSLLDDSVRVAPISIIEALGTLPREHARSELGLPADGDIALVTLGSGRLGEVATPGRIAVEALLKLPGWHVAVTRSPIATNEIELDRAGRLTEMRGVYPLARYLSAFDLAVSSAGYNAVHELVPAGVPTLLVANTSTRTDDQSSRAASLESQGLAFAVNDDDSDGLRRKLEAISDTEARSRLSEQARASRDSLSGAAETGVLATAFADGFLGRRLTIPDRIAATVQASKETTKSVLGEAGTERLKRLFGRQPSPVHQRSSVRVIEGHPGSLEGDDVPPLAVLDKLSTNDLDRGHPVEHVLPGSSLAYRERRLEIIDRYYDVVT